MGINTQSWSSTVPSGTSSIRQGDDQIRSITSIVQSVVNDEHYFDNASASSLSGGIHKLGSARVFMNATRASLATPSSADSNGRLAYAADTQSLHVLGASSATTINWGATPAGGRWKSASSQHATSGATSALPFVTEEYDVGGYASAGSFEVTIPSALTGRHLVTATIQISSANTGTTRLAIQQGSNNTTLAMSSVGSTTAPSGLCVSAIVNTAVDGDTFTPVLFQNSGGALNFTQFYFAVQRL